MIKTARFDSSIVLGAVTDKGIIYDQISRGNARSVECKSGLFPHSYSNSKENQMIR